MLKKIISLILSIILILLLNNYSQAASANIQCNNTAYVNSPITISVSGSAVQWNLYLKVNGQVIASNNELENVQGNKNISFSGTYTPTTEGTLNVTLEGSATEASDGSTIKSFANKSITVVKKENNAKDNVNSSSNSNSNIQTQTQTKSNVVTLSNLGIKGQYDFTGFTSSKTSYSVTVPNDVESVEIYASKGQNGQKISGTGVKQLQEGANAVNVVVTAEDGKTTKTYTVNIERKALEENTEEQTEETQESTTFGLKDLKVEGMELTPEFNTDTYSYTVQLTEDKSSLGLTTIATDEKASIEVNGNEDLKDGENIITIIVKDETGEKTVTYQITVNKTVSNNEKTEATVQNINNSKKKKILILGCGVILIILIIVIITVIKKKKDSNNGDYYQSNIEIQDNNTSELKYEEPKKKHSKGKRFK